MDTTVVKAERLLQIYSKLVNGEVLKKKRIGAALSCHGTEHPARLGGVALLFCGGGACSGCGVRQAGVWVSYGSSGFKDAGKQRDPRGLQNSSGEPFHAAG